MCGRYFINTGISETVEKALHVFMEPETEQDVTPGMAPQILLLQNGELRAAHMKWGVSRPGSGSLIINARAEAVLNKPFFKTGILFNRCLIPASRFYEWDAEKNKAVFDLPGQDVMYLAGFYQESEREYRFVILTTEANDSMRPVHDRMPLMIPPEDAEKWLRDAGSLPEFLKREMPELHRTQEYEQMRLF